MATLPTLPTTFTVPYSLPTGGTTHVCTTSAQFTTALSNAALGDVIELEAGTTFTGPFTLPNKTGTGWIYIVSSALSSLPAAGTRVVAADASNMPKLTVTQQADSAIVTATSAHHYRLVGIEMKPPASTYITQLVTTGGGATSDGNLPSYIVFDRCYIHGDATVGGRRGMELSGQYMAVVECRMEDFKEVGADTQCIFIKQGRYFHIVNNFLSAAGENFMSGGTDPSITNNVPGDLEFRRNHCYKPTSWDGSSWSVKNIWELKNAKLVLCEGNIFENIWAAGQNGFAFQLTPRNQDGGATWCTVEDVTVRKNRFINCGAGINILGTDDIQTSQRAKRLLIEDNEINVTSYSGTSGRVLQMGDGPEDVTFRHNTSAAGADHSVVYFYGSPDINDFVFQDNICEKGTYGIIGDASGTGTTALNDYCTAYTVSYNAFIGGSSSGYPAGNFYPANNAAVGFVDSANGDYALTAQSTYHNAGSDGEDLGADIAAINAAIAGTGSLLAGPANVRWRPA